VGVVFQPDARWSLYGSITTAFDPQTTVGVDAQGNSDFEPETARQFESGVKAELANGRIDTTLALFDITKANILVPIGGNVFDAVGQARSRGLEFDLRVKPVDNWQTILGYAYTDAKVTEDRRAVRVGAALVGNSKHALNLWSRYDATSGAVRGLGLGAGLIWRGDRPGSFPGDLVGPGSLPYVTLPHYLRLDAGIYYARGRSELTLKVNNVLDTLYYESSQLAIRILPGSPREALVSWRFRI
jgi:iron complex outermembrane receptor protein